MRYSYSYCFIDSAWAPMPRDVMVHYKFHDKGFQVKVKGEGVYYYLYDSWDTEVSTIAFNLVTKKFYMKYCVEG